MLYQRGGVWWWKFKFAGRVFRESSKSSSKEIARRAENKRRRELEEGYHGLKKRQAPQTFKSASDAWLELKKPTLAPKSYTIEKTSLKHVLPVFGQKLLTDIEARDISRYQQLRRKEGAAPKSINLEVGTIRAILRRHRLWANIQPDVRMLPTRDDIGKALSVEEEKRLLDACAESRSRSLLPAVMLALNTGMRYSELRLLRWQQLGLEQRTVRVGISKTKAGTGRVIPLNDRATKVLQFWADQFPERKQEHFVFPSEHYGLAGNDADPHALVLDPAKALGSWKTAWKNARKKANVKVRFHDLRHTAVSRMLEGGVPLAVVASLLGWSPSTTTKMAQRYGHIGNTAHRDAVAVLDAKEKPAKSKKQSRKKSVGKGKPKSRRPAPAEILPTVN